jgi:hypothetical protein
VHCGPNRSKSRGHLHALSADPAQHPKIVFNYLSHPDDMPEWRKVVRLTREIVGQAAMDKYRQDEVSPGGHLLSDAEIDAAVRAGVESAYHPCGTCRMGSGTDDMDVVDPDLRVLGVDGLRVRRRRRGGGGGGGGGESVGLSACCVCARLTRLRTALARAPRPVACVRACTCEPHGMTRGLGGRWWMLQSCRASPTATSTRPPS